MFRLMLSVRIVTEKSVKWKGERVGIAEMKRHYSNYFRGIPNFKPVRIQLVTNDNYLELLDILGQVTGQFELPEIV